LKWEESRDEGGVRECDNGCVSKYFLLENILK
jgi:hypothetical protein